MPGVHSPGLTHKPQFRLRDPREFDLGLCLAPSVVILRMWAAWGLCQHHLLVPTPRAINLAASGQILLLEATVRTGVTCPAYGTAGHVVVKDLWEVSSSCHLDSQSYHRHQEAKDSAGASCVLRLRARESCSPEQVGHRPTVLSLRHLNLLLFKRAQGWASQWPVLGLGDIMVSPLHPS